MASPINHLSSSMIIIMQLIIVTALLNLSVSSAEKNGETRRCHWCGPLAEQVHRSRRAPSCDEGGDHVTACEPGYQYCAVVATAPPYIESRFCVKLYQDECYPLYCNSTKTWKMTCPCRGDLCNGPNTEREDEAFGALSKLVAKTHNVRIKRSVQESRGNTYGCCNTNNRNTIKNYNSTENLNKGDDLDKKPTEIPSQDSSVKTQWMPTNIEIEIKKIDDNGMQDENKMTTKQVEQRDTLLKETTTVATQAPTVVTQAPTVVTQAPEVVVQKPIVVTMKAVEMASITDIKPTVQMSPAESLQQAANAKEKIEKPTEISTTETIGTNTEREITTFPNVNMSKPGKGFGVKLSSNLFMLLVLLLIYLTL